MAASSLHKGQPIWTEDRSELLTIVCLGSAVAWTIFWLGNPLGVWLALEFQFAIIAAGALTCLIALETASYVMTGWEARRRAKLGTSAHSIDKLSADRTEPFSPSAMTVDQPIFFRAEAAAAHLANGSGASAAKEVELLTKQA